MSLFGVQLWPGIPLPSTDGPPGDLAGALFGFAGSWPEEADWAEARRGLFRPVYRDAFTRIFALGARGP